MNFTRILAGYEGFNAKAMSRAVLLTQIAFDYNRALNQKDKHPTTFDAALESELTTSETDNGLPKPIVLNKDELLEGHAAAYVLLRRVLAERHPESGKSVAWLADRLVSLPNSIVQKVDSQVIRNVERAKAAAKMLEREGLPPLDITARVSAIKDEAAKLAAKLSADMRDQYTTAVKARLNSDEETLIDEAVETAVNAGRNIASEITRAADAMQDKARQRMLEGKFASIEADIYALTTEGQRRQHAAA